jgi:hypothetical protein
MHLGDLCQPPAAAVPAPRPSSAVENHEPPPALEWFEREDAPEKSQFQGLAFMKQTIRASHYHPVPVIRKEQRDQEPWTLISERMGGEPREQDWSRPDVPMGGQLVLLDRNGSYPSACSSVPLAPNLLTHTGPQAGYDPARAGIYLIDRPEWTDPRMPHPLGHLVARAEPQIWITTPHLKLLTQLAAADRLAPVIIRDSWTGKANSSLFQAFYKAVREARPKYLAQDQPELGQDNPYKIYKLSVSRPLRLLWPKKASSPFWRPDWRVSMVAEASVRHWVKADRAVQQGAFLVTLRNVDEALFWTPDGELPPGYVEGSAFGEVKRKAVEQ